MTAGERMDFRILGPIEVSGGDGLIPLGGIKQRALLALLVLRRGEVVSTDTLIDELWAERPPPSAVKSIQVYVSHLRKALGAGVLETRGRGYRVRIEPEQLDVDRFERLLERGRELRANGANRDAARVLRAALAEWRGAPLADLAYEPFAQTEIARLGEVRIAALEERLDAELALGRHDALIPELDALTREHPLRERLRGQLMLALYRAGRHADALESYRRFSRMLRDDLGLEPGRELRDLERAILEQSGELDAPRRSATGRSRREAQGALFVVLGGALLLVAAAAAALVLTRGRETARIVSVASNSVALIDPATNAVVADVPVGDGPTNIAVGNGKVWVVSRDAQTISVLDSRTRALVKTFAIGATPADVAVARNRAWVGDSVRSAVVELDAASGAVVRTIEAPPLTPPPRRRSLPVGGEIAVGLGAVWFSSGNATVTRIDPRTGRVVSRIRHDGFAGGDRPFLAVGEGAVWVSAYPGVVTRIDPRRGAVAASIPAGEGPIAAGLGSVWVVADELLQIDPSESPTAPVRTIPIGRGPQAIAVGAGSVWVANRDGTVSRVDPLSGRVIRTIRVGGSPTGLAVDDEGGLWVSVA